MNILFLINEFERGGAERVVSYLLNQPPKSHPEIVPILFTLEKSDYAYSISDKIKIYSGSKYHSSNFIKFIKLPFLALRLKRIIKQNNVKKVISFLTRANYVNILSRYCGSDHHCIISERNTPSLVYGSWSMTDIINRLLIRYLYPSCEEIIAVSKGVQIDLEDKFHISEDKISVIYNPYDIVQIKQKSQEDPKHVWLENISYTTIINIGRLEKQKNQTLLLRAFKQVNDRHPESRLLILGEGSERKHLSKLIRDLGIDSKVQIPGQQNNPFTYLSKADLFVLSSDFEGFPNVLVEAMVCGCPVISTDCPSGPNEIITHNINGILVPIGDIDAMSSAIVLLIKNNQLRNTLIKNAKKRVSDFSLDKIINQYYQLLLNKI